MSYEELLIEADNLNIIVKEKNLKLYDGLCVGNRIAIHKCIKTDAGKNCVLAEEIGHYLYTIGDITDQKKSTVNRKQERIARRWAYKKLVPIHKFVDMFNLGFKSKYEIAEYLNITEEFLEEAIKYYKEKYGTYFELDDYLIYFEPNLGVMKMF